MGSESIVHEAMRARGIIILVKSNQLVKTNIEANHFSQVKARVQSFLTAKTLQIWRALFATSGLQHIPYQQLNQSERSIDDRALVGFYLLLIIITHSIRSFVFHFQTSMATQFLWKPNFYHGGNIELAYVLLNTVNGDSVTLPATDAWGQEPVLMFTKDPVPMVQFKSPGSKQHWPNTAACWSATCNGITQ